MNKDKCSRCGSVLHTLLECGVPLKRGQPPKDGVPATGQIQLRVTMARKNAYVRAAKPRKLTAWIFEHLDKASKCEPTNKPTTMTLEKFIKKGINAQESVNKILAEAGLPMVEITTEDRLRGAIIEAVGLIEAGKSGKAYLLLKEAMKI